MANINSYAENVNKLTKSAKELVEFAEAINESIAGNQSEVIVNDSIIMPSYQNVINRVNRVENTISKLVNGKGTVEANDGTYRKITINSISRPAQTITISEGIDKFGIDPNWFFELLQYPRCVVKVDLKNQIDDDSDRVLADRIIIDATQSLTTDDTNTILQGNLSYGDLLEYLDSHSIEYREDKEEISFPLTYEQYRGEFKVSSIALIKNQVSGMSEKWYYLTTINYSTINEDGIIVDSGRVLTIGDFLRFGQSLYKITDINQTEKRVKLEYSSGYENVSVFDVFEFYNDPFKEKVINIGISIDEYDVIYLKGVNETYNILSSEWSTPLSFYTNTLTFENDPNQTFETYYNSSVADFGRRWIAQIKEGQIPAYGSKKPNSPTLNADDLRVVQINTQLEVTLDSEKYNNITSEIASTKSNITATRNTISVNKTKLIQETDPNSRETIQNTINSDTEKLNNLTTQFSSLTEELNSLLNSAGAINYSPKYHIRGFFAIPEPQYTLTTQKIGKQQIIGFETLYRYLHTDETGTNLATFNYTDTSTGIMSTGVFSDWNLSVSSFLEKKKNPTTDTYEWVNETADGNSISINQIDIPIRSGEKVEIKVRSISEAGYPYNPLKSEWSNSVIIAFPDNLTTSDSVTTILDSVKSDMTSVVLQDTLTAAGIYSHIADTNSKFKHNALNIEYDETTIDASTGTTTTHTLTLYDKIKSLSDRLAALENR